MKPLILKPSDLKTHGVKYMGSKRRLLPAIHQIFDGLRPTTALDVFTGTTRVAQMLRGMGVVVTTADNLEYARVFSRAWVSGNPNMARVSHMCDVLNLDHVAECGWFTKTYCDVTGKRGGLVRYMTPENGTRVDAIMKHIVQEHASGFLTDDDRDMMVTSLIMAMDKVDNTVGVQQAYLKKWCTRSRNRLEMKPYSPPTGPQGSHIAGDVLQVSFPTADVAYIDPPYTQHAYGSYYHIWESIARWDKPEVDLKTNRRVDQCYGNATSQWNRPNDAPHAFRRLLRRLDVGRVILSYAGGSVVPLDDLTDIIAESHAIKNIHKVSVNENVMSKIGNGSKASAAVARRIEWIVEATPRS